MQSIYTEQSYENAVIELFQNMGYTNVYGSDVERDFQSLFCEDVLVPFLIDINEFEKLPQVMQDEIQKEYIKIFPKNEQEVSKNDL